MTEREVRILMVGIGGYGDFYLRALESIQTRCNQGIVAVVDPMAKNSEHWVELDTKRTPLFDTIQEFTASGITADLAVISSPIAFHADQACHALNTGMNVLCEKPLTATMAEAQRMIDAASKAENNGRFLEIGYQWSFSEAIQNLKKDVLTGVFGRPRTVKTWVAWPRKKSYYRRNSWAGCIHDKHGRPVYDSPANNATAHFLHNMLFVLGPQMDQSASPVTVESECYRANPIENFDAACCRVKTEQGADALFYTAHCVEKEIGPVFKFEFDHAVVDYPVNGLIRATFADGTIQEYGDPNSRPERKLIHCLERIAGVVGENTTICSAEAAAAQTACINALQKAPILTFPAERVRVKAEKDGDSLTYVVGLEEIMGEAFEKERLLSEVHLSV
jgi:predicted dehydrogenase